MTKPALSVVLPCYNEARSLESLLHGYRKALDRNRIPEGDFELILVDNGSTDDTDANARALLENAQYSFARLVTVTPNRGYGGGILAGLEGARADTLGFSHADEQCPPEDVFSAWAELKRSAAGVLATGKLVKGERFGRPVGAWLFSRAFELCGLLLLRRRLFEVNAQPKLFPRALLSAIRTDAPSDFSFDLHVLLRAREADYAIGTVPVQFGTRRHGESKWASTFHSRLRTSLRVLRFMREYASRRARSAPKRLPSPPRRREYVR